MRTKLFTGKFLVSDRNTLAWENSVIKGKQKKKQKKTNDILKSELVNLQLTRNTNFEKNGHLKCEIAQKCLFLDELTDGDDHHFQSSC